MLARRFSCPPVFEAAYEPREVPEAARDMRGSVIFRPTREDWLRLLGEMIQLTNEAVRRRAASARDASKPLQLEFMADRIDVDDPLFGYMAVTKDKGWLQGFITATTFTTWHRGFRWDSLSPCVDHEPSHDHDNASSPSGSTAVADSGGAVIGGHLCPGSLVRTTAELVIGLLPDWRFRRELDPATGYAELEISPRAPGWRAATAALPAETPARPPLP